MKCYKEWLAVEKQIPRQTLHARKCKASNTGQTRRNREVRQTLLVQGSSVQNNLIEDVPETVQASAQVSETQISQENSADDVESSTEDNFSGEICPEEDSCDTVTDEVTAFGDAYFSKNEETICPCAKVTANDVMVMCLAIGLRHNLSWAAQVDILQMVNTIYDDNKVASSKYLYLKHFDVGKTSASYHYFCPVCERSLGKKEAIADEVICDCGEIINSKESTSFFVSVSIQEQLKELLKDPAVAESILTYRFNRKKINPEALEDIYDGKEYQKHFVDGNILSYPQNFSYSFNTDGIPTGKSSNKTLWPIYITINELPPHDRDKYVLLAGLYIGNKDPNQTVFLSPFVDEANDLSTNGFTWKHGELEMRSLCIPLCAVVDSVARYHMLNMSSYAAYYGCTFCYTKSVRTTKGQRFTVALEPQESRTKESTIQDVAKAYDRRQESDPRKRSYRGVKGPSPLLFLNHFNLIAGFVPDYMHAILQGVIRTHVELLFESTRKKCWKNMTDQIAMDYVVDLIDQRLLKIATPHIVARLPRTLHDRAIWKASEWRAWLVMYCVPCLEGILKRKYVNHLALLSTATTILLEKSISSEAMEKAQMLLLRYVYLFQKYFGDVNMTYNVHLLTHIPAGVLNWGPLWTHNCFLYEGQNRHLLQLHHSPHQVLKQILNKFLTFGALPLTVCKYASSSLAVEFCESILSKQLKVFVALKGLTLFRKVSRCMPLSEEEVEALSAISSNIVDGHLIQYDAMLFNHARFTTKLFSGEKKNNDSFVFLNQNKFAQIEKILKDDNSCKVYVLVRVIETGRGIPITDSEVPRTLVPVFDVIGFRELICVSPRHFEAASVFIDVLGLGSFVCKVPYGCYSD